MELGDCELIWRFDPLVKNSAIWRKGCLGYSLGCDALSSIGMKTTIEFDPLSLDFHGRLILDDYRGESRRTRAHFCNMKVANCNILLLDSMPPNGATFPNLAALSR